MRVLVRLGLVRNALPDDASRMAIERQDDELVHALLRKGSARCVLRLTVDAHGNSGRQEEEVPPDHGRCVTAPGDLHLPRDVLRLAPDERRVGGP